jgi:methyltransferase (TIGR00027 family)
MDGIALTARWTAASRARETERSDRLFDDPLAAALAGDQGFALFERTPRQARDNPYLPLRTRFFDDWALRATGEHGLRQVVMVAAGMDTRAFRLTWPDGVRLWELDRPDLLELKRTLLETANAEPRCERRVVAVDLAAAGWPDRLREAGFAPAFPAAFVVEGLLQYLSEDAVDSVLAQVAATAAPGSRLAVDVLSADYLVHPWMREYLASLKVSGRPWRFGTNEPEALLERHGWRIERVAEPGHEGANFGRWPWPAAPRAVPGLPRGFFATAVKGRFAGESPEFGAE